MVRQNESKRVELKYKLSVLLKCVKNANNKLLLLC
jgi:hypothetical protein